jgi:hypothetical protein
VPVLKCDAPVYICPTYKANILKANLEGFTWLICIQTDRQTYTYNYIYIYIYTCIHILTHEKPFITFIIHLQSASTHTYMYIHVTHIDTHTHTHTHMHTHARMRTHTNACVHDSPTICCCNTHTREMHTSKCSCESRMSGGSLWGLLFFGHLNKFAVAVTVTVIIRESLQLIYCTHTHTATHIRLQIHCIHTYIHA